ncbi:ABC transporter permease [uncultured Ruminococcus sp.]|uniref:ABC transporter permease n=1 Tax=uncultured Ruminococcus sp. TaxID=165186 RepID=UPI0025D9F2AF|nr:ABC transporter permease subunit [uncultured Ruminococcus sp.]
MTDARTLNSLETQGSKKTYSVGKIILNIAIVTLFAGTVITLSFIKGKVSAPKNTVYVFIMGFIWLYHTARAVIKKDEYHPDIAVLIYSLFLIWDINFRILGNGNPVLSPPMENVFEVFLKDSQFIAEGIGHSLMILVIGFSIALITGNILGMIVGWVKRLNNDFTPIAKVLSPIPPMVYTPYLIALMPTFTSASIAVIGIGMFWPIFLGMINRVGSINSRLIDSAKAMNVSTPTMLFKVILPYSIPSIVGSLKIQISTIFMILIMAEMIGATSGLGFFIKKYSDYADYARVLAGIFVVGAVITILNVLLDIAEKKLIKWKAV